MRCPECRADDCTRIEINVSDGESLLFFSCRNCEAKWWKDKSGDSIDLNEVLALASQQSKPARAERAE